MRPAIIFTGPTLPPAQAQEIADVVCLPPAVQGSVVAAVQRFEPRAILIIDGGFQAEPAVRHKEILWAIDRGIPVIGAASMGALRAAELYPYMRGVGLIYRWYRRFAFAPDDAVAVLHGPQEVRFPALTTALVDVRRTLSNAKRKRLVSGELADRLDGTARGLNFRDRSWERIVGETMPGATTQEREALRQSLASVFVPQKRRDAIAAVQLLRGEVAAPAEPAGFRMTVAFLQDLEDAGLEV